MDRPRIMVLEDDADYRLELASYLQANGLDVTVAETLNDIHSNQHNHEWMIYLVNFGTNTNRGLEFLKGRERGRDGPVLVLSDSDDPIDRIVCLELGADDGIPKTMHQREILARIRVAARRKPSTAAAASFPPFGTSPSAPADDKSATGWRFSSEDRMLVGPDGNAVELTTDQFRLLDLLIAHRGKTLSREFLSRTLFDRATKLADRSIDNLVARLRRRLGEPARAPRIVRTARSGGYFFSGFPEPAETAVSRPARARMQVA